MDFVRALAKEDHLIVVATIHQPATRVFLGFDNLVLLSGGRCASVSPAFFFLYASCIRGKGTRVPRPARRRTSRRWATRCRR